ncbi:MAG: MerR family transcriptional regulator [Myxococcota bacterium]|nr:MerR family transcriptional regulator [Myxococcota bacterium]
MSIEYFTIGALAKKVGKTTRTLRFYEEKSLIEPAKRTQGGYRLYSHDSLVRLQWIEQLQDMGFSIKDIQNFVSQVSDIKHPPSKMVHISQVYVQRLKETQEEISRLREQEKELQASLAMLDSCQTCTSISDHTACRSCMEITKKQQNRLKIPDLLQPLLG